MFGQFNFFPAPRNFPAGYIYAIEYIGYLIKGILLPMQSILSKCEILESGLVYLKSSKATKLDPERKGFCSCFLTLLMSCLQHHARPAAVALNFLQ